ncbi:AraC family transcriptional regulator [Streptomyces liangshanensis]|uniref:AraC family transcriptional regulator n=1 Tax=Streptomyces liangshanensis TaxID=2717324 RepID=A0A6G9H1U7_9ACTN|nr:AraC family transcriptional regulator [Streptomyces liangshanensis]QIQ04259.1 AraC family transcriptional regulator [Streptomyces liangshanensis]
MDVLDDYLAGVRAHGAVFCRTVSTPPWGLRFTEPAPLALAVMLHGDGWIIPAEEDPVALRRGEIVLIRGAEPYTVADHPASAPRILVDGDDHCTTLGDPASPRRNWRIAGRTSGPADDRVGEGSDLLVTAGYRIGGDLSLPLLDTLPPVAVVPRDPSLAPLLDLLADETTHDRPGQQVILDRMLDLLLVRSLRAWFDQAGSVPPLGYRALSDPLLGHVLRRLHEEPSRPWTVASLAAEAGLSRTTFARRFTSMVGRPPLAYLTHWRMTLAADRLRRPGATIAAVAREVGYHDAFTFSSAFKRTRGVSPSAHRGAFP